MIYKGFSINERINIKSWLRAAYSLQKLVSIDYTYQEFWQSPKRCFLK